MIVSMLQFVFELPDACTLKDKRRVVHSLKTRITRKFRASCAEVDLLDSVRFAHLGAAVVSNSREHGEEVMRKALDLVEDELAVRIHDSQIVSETF